MVHNRAAFEKLSGKAEASSVRSAPQEALRLVESRAIRSGLFWGQYTRSGLFMPSCQGTRCGLFDEMSDGLRLRHIHGVAAFDLDDRRACAFGHSPLSVRRDHLVFGRDLVPAWLCSPRRLGDRATERLDTPRNLRVGHERSHVRTYVRGECGRELGLIEE